MVAEARALVGMATCAAVAVAVAMAMAEGRARVGMASLAAVAVAVAMAMAMARPCGWLVVGGRVTNLLTWHRRPQ